jgi:hypothetical protein
MLYIILIGWSFFAHCQEVAQDTSLYRITTLDNNFFTGVIVDQDMEKVIIQSETIGQITVPRSAIKSIERLEKSRLVDGRLWLKNPQSTRYFWGPNSFTIKPGEGYYQNVWIAVNQVTIGFTEHFSIGGGFIPLFLATSPTPVWITPRFSIPIVKDKFSTGGGALIGTVVGEQETSFGVIFGTFTIGNRDKNMNINFGWSYAEGDFSVNPAGSLSFMLRIGPNGYLLSENYVLNNGFETLVLLSAGGRSLIRRVSLDYGLVVPATTGVFLAIPWLGLTVPFKPRS